jgi:hypothetical protein
MQSISFHIKRIAHHDRITVVQQSEFGGSFRCMSQLGMELQGMSQLGPSVSHEERRGIEEEGER